MSKTLDIVPIKDKTKLEVRQSPTPHLPRTPLRMLACAASLRKKYDSSQYDIKQADV